MSRRRLTIRWRLAISAALIIIITGAAMLGLVYQVLKHVPEYEFPQTVIEETTSEESPSPLPDDNSSSVEVELDSSGCPVVDTGDSIGVIWSYQTAPGWWVVAVSDTQTDKDGNRGSTSSLTPGQDVMSSLLKFSAIVIGVLAILAGAVAWWWSGRILRPLREVSKAVHEADASNLDKRINWKGPKDEIKMLADDVDGMLDRLDRSFTVQRNFAANASHELITPLTTSQAMIDVALGEEGISTGEHDLLTKLRGLGTRSLSTVDALMDLAEIDSVPLEQEPVDMTPMVAQSVANAKDLANEHNVSLDYTNSSADSVVNANDVLLTRAVDNLVDNAIVHNLSTDGQAWVTCADEDGNIVLTIENTGDVLTDEQVSSLGQPFYRVAGRVAGTTSDPATGHGLGLALARTIIEAHGGTLLIAAREGGGLRVTVTLPQMKPE